MKCNILPLIGLIIGLLSPQLFAMPNLYLGGIGGTLVDPAMGDYSEFYLQSYDDQIEFTLLFEETQFADNNTFYLHDDIYTARRPPQ